MPESPMPMEKAEGEGSDVEAAVTQLGQGIEALAAQEPAFGPVLEAFKQALAELSGGGGAPQAEQMSTPEQGASGAQPMTMARPK